MLNELFWLEFRSGRWHAWPVGGRSSLCGTITRESLRKAPAKQILRMLPTDAPACISCTRRRLGRTPIVQKQQLAKGSVTAQWLSYLRRHLITKRIKISTKNELLLAGHLATIGAPSEPKATFVYEQIRTLLLTPRPQIVASRGGRGTSRMYKITRLKEALAALPPTTTALLHVAQGMALWRKITGRSVDSKVEKFQTDTVVETMLAVPNLEAYIRHLHNKGWSSLAQMFHPNTLARSQQEPALRGALDPKTSAYWEQAKQQLTIVEE